MEENTEFEDWLKVPQNNKPKTTQPTQKWNLPELNKQPEPVQEIKEPEIIEPEPIVEAEVVKEEVKPEPIPEITPEQLMDSLPIIATVEESELEPIKIGEKEVEAIKESPFEVSIQVEPKEKPKQKRIYTKRVFKEQAEKMAIVLLRDCGGLSMINICRLLGHKDSSKRNIEFTYSHNQDKFQCKQCAELKGEGLDKKLEIK